MAAEGWSTIVRLGLEGSSKAPAEPLFPYVIPRSKGISNRPRPERLPLVPPEQGRERPQVAVRRARPPAEDAHARVDELLGLGRPGLGLERRRARSEADADAHGEEAIDPPEPDLEARDLEHHHLGAVVVN